MCQNGSTVDCPPPAQLKQNVTQVNQLVQQLEPDGAALEEQQAQLQADLVAATINLSRKKALQEGLNEHTKDLTEQEVTRKRSKKRMAELRQCMDGPVPSDPRQQAEAEAEASASAATNRELLELVQMGVRAGDGIKSAEGVLAQLRQLAATVRHEQQEEEDMRVLRPQVQLSLDRRRRRVEELEKLIAATLEENYEDRALMEKAQACVNNKRQRMVGPQVGAPGGGATVRPGPRRRPCHRDPGSIGCGWLARTGLTPVTPASTGRRRAWRRQGRLRSPRCGLCMYMHAYWLKRGWPRGMPLGPQMRAHNRRWYTSAPTP